MSEYKVGDKVWISGTVRQVSEREPNALYNTYVVEIDNHKGHTDQIPVRFREGVLARRLDTETEAIVVNAYVESVRQRERAAIVAWLRAEHTRLEALANKQSGYMRDDWTDGGANFVDFAADAIEDCAYMRGDDE